MTVLYNPLRLPRFPVLVALALSLPCSRDPAIPPPSLLACSSPSPIRCAQGDSFSSCLPPLPFQRAYPFPVWTRDAVARAYLGLPYPRLCPPAISLSDFSSLADDFSRPGSQIEAVLGFRERAQLRLLLIVWIRSRLYVCVAFVRLLCLCRVRDGVRKLAYLSPAAGTVYFCSPLLKLLILQVDVIRCSFLAIGKPSLWTYITFAFLPQ